MKKWKIPAFCAFVLACLAMNFFGSQFASAHNWPLWLDCAGTMLMGYFAGPFCGAAVGATTNLLFYLYNGDPWYYCVVSISIGILIGFAGKYHMLRTLFGTLCAGAAAAVTAVVASVPINILLNNNATGNLWGDSVISFMREQGVPRFLALPLGQLYLELLDKLALLIIVYLILKIRQGILKNIEKKKEKEKEDEMNPVAGALAVLLCIGLCMAPAPAAVRAEAAETGTLQDVNYNDYVQTVYSSASGLPCGEANDIAETNDGILWIGTYAGLYRYDGREFRWMDNYDSVRNVNCLYVDEEGRLWIGSNDNGLSICINEEIVNVIDQAQGLPANSVRSIIKSSDGYYYIGTTSSMQILTLNCGLKVLNVLKEVSYADDSAADEYGHVAAISNSGTLFLLQGGRVVCSRQIPNSDEVYKSCFFDPQGRLLVGTSENRIYVYDISRGYFEEISVMDTGKLKSIKDLYYLENGTMFVSADNGIGYYDAAGRLQIINTNDFNNSIDRILIDYQGNLWFTSSRLGLLRLAPSDFRDIYSTVGMDNQVVNTIVKWKGAYYIGTDKGLDVVDLSGREQITNEWTKLLEGQRIRCMLVDDRDNLWICTYGNGLIEIDKDGNEYRYNRENGTFGGRARVVTQLSDGTILAAGDTGISFIRDHTVENTILYSEGKISSMILTVTELEDGRILAGTDGNGIAIIEDRQVAKMMTRADGLSSEVILRTIRDPRTGGVFIVTSNGLCYMNTDETIRQLSNFPYFNNYDIWIKGMDTLYVMSSAGIYIADRSELLSGKDEITYELLDSRRGLNSSLTANSWCYFDDETGDLFLACDTGVFAINTNRFSSGSVVYRMSVPKVKLDGVTKRVDRNTAIRLERGVSRLELFPEVINFTIQEPYVGYKLEGFENEWTVVPQNSLNSIIYTNLPAGDYTFRLAVYDSNKQNIVAERTYEIYREKEFYDNNWFIFYILTVPMFTVGWVTWLLVKRREQKMERQLAEANRQAEMGKQTVLAIARAVDAKDERTSEHSYRVALYSRAIAKEYGMNEKECNEIEWAARMHDIGKIAIPDNILNKPARLTDEEYAIMKSHTLKGAEILKDFTLLDHVTEGCTYHHERPDGRGYPYGLKGDEIPLYARIIGVADAFDAMTANRVYRKQTDFSYVLGELEKGRGTQFDPVFVDALLKLIKDGVIDLNKIYNVTAQAQENNQEENKQNIATIVAVEAKQQQEGIKQPKPEETAKTEPPKPDAPTKTEPPKPDEPAKTGKGGEHA